MVWTYFDLQVRQVSNCVVDWTGRFFVVLGVKLEVKAALSVDRMNAIQCFPISEKLFVKFERQNSD